MIILQQGNNGRFFINGSSYSTQGIEVSLLQRSLSIYYRQPLHRSRYAHRGNIHPPPLLAPTPIDRIALKDQDGNLIPTEGMLPNFFLNLVLKITRASNEINFSVAPSTPSPPIVSLPSSSTDTNLDRYTSVRLSWNAPTHLGKNDMGVANQRLSYEIYIRKTEDPLMQIFDTEWQRIGQDTTSTQTDIRIENALDMVAGRSYQFAIKAKATPNSLSPLSPASNTYTMPDRIDKIYMKWKAYGTTYRTDVVQNTFLDEQGKPFADNEFAFVSFEKPIGSSWMPTTPLSSTNVGPGVVNGNCQFSLQFRPRSENKTTIKKYRFVKSSEKPNSEYAQLQMLVLTFFSGRTLSLGGWSGKNNVVGKPYEIVLPSFPPKVYPSFV